MKALRKCLLCLLVIGLILMPVSTAFALEESGIEIRYAHGVCTFDFYKLADFSKTEGFIPATPFDRYTDTIPLLVGMAGMTTEETRLLATTMEAVVLRDGITPSHTAATNEDGALALTDLQQGMYLVLGTSTTDGEYRYTPSPILVSVPTRDIHDVWQYYVILEHNKVVKENLDQPTTHREVIKIWQDDGNESSRPAAITVQLLQDGNVYDTVQLSDDNNWMYRWTELPAAHTYTAVEVEVSEPYTMSVERDRTAIYVTNTYNGPPPPPPPDLPQTGQLWWPVPLMVALGLCSLLLSACYRRRDEEGRV